MVNPSELGAYTNNLPNKEGMKKLVKSVNDKQEKLTAGDNITITSENVISAVDTTYTAGDNITISEGVISAVDTVYTAGSGIDITSGVISFAKPNTTEALSTTVTIEMLVELGLITRTEPTPDPTP